MGLTVLWRFLIAAYTIVAMTASFASQGVETQANVTAEIVLHSAGKHADPFNELTVDAVFTKPGGAQLRVPAFWDGGSVWKVRFASPVPGVYRFVTECSDASDKGLNGVTGAVKVTRYTGKNPLYKHGPVRVAADRRHLEYADGTPFFWLADTWWMGLAQRLRWPGEFQAMTADRVAKGFNVVQIVAGLYPDMFPFDKRGENEAGFPWEAEYARINPAYFDRADERIRYLVDQGISPCIVGAWGYFMQWMGVEKLERHWRYLIARYGSMPVVWCGAGEADLPWYLAPGFPYEDTEQVHKWTAVMRSIRRTDPFHRVLTIHPTAVKYLTSRHAVDDQGLLDFDMLQTPHGQESAAEAAMRQMRESYAASPKMPVIDGEAAYEMLSDSLPTRWTRAMFWVCMLNGAAGHTYGANGIWQNNRPGDPHGKSPHGGTYGKISSQEAMHLPGSGQVGMGKKLFEKYPWQRFEPHPEWASYDAVGHATFAGSHWIWFPEGNPAIDAPVAARYFRLGFVIPAGSHVKSARLLFSGDDAVVVYLNGVQVGESHNWRMGSVAAGLELQIGANVLAARAENLAADVTKNPAGFLATMEITFADGSTRVIRSDTSWKASQSGPAGWNSIGFDDSAWPAAMVVGMYGDGPWFRAGAWDSDIGPQSSGIPSGVRFTYMLRPVAVTLQGLKANARYSVRLFDPVSGSVRSLGSFVADAGGRWMCQPPAGWDHDWLLIVEPS